MERLNLGSFFAEIKQQKEEGLAQFPDLENFGVRAMGEVEGKALFTGEGGSVTTFRKEEREREVGRELFGEGGGKRGISEDVFGFSDRAEEYFELNFDGLNGQTGFFSFD